MNILVLNAGSSSLKYQFFKFSKLGHDVLSKGGVERIGIKGSCVVHKGKGGVEIRIEGDIDNHTEALKKVFDALCHAEYGVIKSIDDISAFGHRLVHGGEDFDSSVILDDVTLNACKKNIELAPLHMPANLACVESCRALKATTPNVGVFDTAFHSTMSQTAYMYALPYEYYEKYKIRKYGFHGTSHRYVSDKACEYLKAMGVAEPKVVTCHLGNGSSIAAVKDGVVLDTSMGLTPLEGLLMGTRSGDLDPAVITFLMEKLSVSAQEVLDILNKKSGALGISGISSDFRDLEDAAAEGNQRALLALNMCAYRIKKYIGSYLAVLNGADAVVFTGGIGENSFRMRKRILDDMCGLGLELDDEKNNTKRQGVVTEIQTAASKVKALVVPTDEELVIARETLELVDKK